MHYIVWKFNVPIVYPRKKFNDPKVRFSCYLNDSHKTEFEEVVVVEEKHVGDVLPNFCYADRHNILEELNESGGRKQKFQYEDVALKSKASTMSDLQIDNDEPIVVDAGVDGLASGDGLGVSGGVHLFCLVSFPITVSLVIKLKSTKPAGRNNLLLSTLNIESSDELHKLYSRKDNIFFNIINLSVTFRSGTVEDLNPKSNGFPIRFKLEDSLNLTYKLFNNDFQGKELDSPIGSDSQAKPCNIKLTLQVQKCTNCYEDQEGCLFKPISNIIVTSWNPFLDFTIIAPPINSSLKGPALAPTPTPPAGLRLPLVMLLQQASFPKYSKIQPRKAALMNVYKQKTGSYQDISESMPALTVTKNNDTFRDSGRLLSKVLLNAASSVTVNLTTTSSTLSGLKLTFTGKLSIKLGEVTTWKLQAINNSPSYLNLSLLVQSPTQSSYNKDGNSNLCLPTSSTALPVVGINQLHSIYNSLKVPKIGVVVLDNDIRFGPLETNSVYETKIRLIGVSKGIFNLDGIKIFDTNTGDGLDFGKLVEVFVV